MTEYSIVKRGKNYHLFTNAGEFQLPAKLFQLLHQDNVPALEHLPHALAGLIRRIYVKTEDRADKYPHDPKLEAAIKTLVEKHEANPLSYLDKYQYDPSDKMRELIPHITPEIKDLMVKERLQFLFANRSANDAYTYAEHQSWGSSSSAFLGNPFMGGFSIEKGWRESAHAARKEFLKKRNNFAIPLLKKPGDRPSIKADYECSERVNHLHLEPKPPAETVNALQKIYEGTNRTPETPGHVNELDEVRVVYSSVPYDEKMHAFPKPERLEFCHDGQVVSTCTDKHTLNALKLKPQDIKVALTVKDEKGRVVHVGATTKGEVHKLKIIKPAKHWHENYLERIGPELEKVEQHRTP
ncbi:MAG: hypothetical protein V1722_04515 [Candidatus Micrarchaeota archaeon]